MRPLLQPITTDESVLAYLNYYFSSDDHLASWHLQVFEFTSLLRLGYRVLLLLLILRHRSTGNRSHERECATKQTIAHRLPEWKCSLASLTFLRSFGPHLHDH